VLALRKEFRDVFVYGTFELLHPEDENTFAFGKEYEDRTALVALNFTEALHHLTLEEKKGLNLLVSTYNKTLPDTLQPYEGSVYLNY
jgi:oligo-1,6-glucosidase